MLRALRDIDVFLAPTSMIPAAPLDEVDASMDTYTPFNLRYSRNTRVANVLGLCALTVPCGFSSEGLPIGLMIHGKPRDEAMVLRVGQAFQQATDWHNEDPGPALGRRIDSEPIYSSLPAERKTTS